MIPSSVPLQPGPNTDSVTYNGQITRLSGSWLILGRVTWGIPVVFLLALFMINLPAYAMQLHAVGDGSVPLRLTFDSVQALQRLGISLDSYALCALILNIAITLVWVLVAAVLFWRKSDDWLVLLISLSLVWWGTGNGSGFVLHGPPWHFLSQCLKALTFSSLILFLTLFPDGRFFPGWMRWITIVEIALWAEARYLFPDTPFNPERWPVPLGSLCLFVFIGSLVGTQVYRYRSASSSLERLQTKWVVYAISISLLTILGNTLFFDSFPRLFPQIQPPGLVPQFTYILAWNIVPVVVPVAIGIAILRYRLWDIDIIINRTLVYGMLTVSIVALYILVVTGLGALLQAQGNLGISLLGTGLVAVLFHPLRNRLQRTVNRLMYGERDDPYRVLTRLGQRLEATLAPDTVLPTIVETVAQALKLPYVAITLKEEGTLTPTASFGVPTREENLVRLPLVAQHELVGELVLSQRAPGEAFTPADQRLLEDLSRQIGEAVYAVRLTADLTRLTVDLQRSRERLVTAREEERRRLRRDLHDGLGPQLASLTMKLETARNRLTQDLLAQTLLSDLAERTQSTVADIRRLVYALRPPALDELGLVSALRELTLQHSDQVAMHLDAPDYLPELSAAVEVAIYRLTQEALTNVVRHAHARHGDIRLALDEAAGWLTLVIQDDGSGLSPARGVGVGLVSMRERAEELSGTCTIEPVESGGTRVVARLPYTRSETADRLVVIPAGVPQEK